MKITEIIPDDMPEWANDGIDSGQFFRVCLAKVKKLEQQVLELKGVVSSQKSRIRMLDKY